MSENLKNKFMQLFNNMNAEENIPVVESILFSDEFNDTKNSLTLAYNSKIVECSKILDDLKIVSEEEKIESLEYSKLVVNSIPKIGKEREFEQKRNEFYNCYNKFQNVGSVHLKTNDFLAEYVQKTFNNCINKNCEKLLHKNEDDTKICIRDCFKFNQYNTYIMANMMNDEFLKFKNSLEKF